MCTILKLLSKLVPEIHMLEVLRKIIIPALVVLVLTVINSTDYLALTPQIQKIFGMLLWLSGAYFFNKLFRVIVWESIVTNNIGHHPPKLLTDFFSAVVYFIACAVIFSNVYNQPITGFWATSGAIGIVLGFALRSLILDIFAGLAMNIDRPFSINDWIMLHGRMVDLHIIGNVKEINWRTTRILTTENVLVVVPNSRMSSAIITNLSSPEEKSRFEFTLCLDFSIPTDRGIRIINAGILDVTRCDGFLSNPRPKVRVHEIADYGVIYRVRYWLLPSKMSPNKSRHLAMTSILKQLLLSGITPTHPKLETSFSKTKKTHVNIRDSSDRKTVLSRIEIFSCLTDKEISEITESVKIQEFRAGHNIIQGGDGGDSMFVIFEGFVDVFADINRSGKEVKVASIQAGNFFGEMSLLTGEQRSATVTACTSVVAIEITKTNILPIIKHRPNIAKKIGILIEERRNKNANKATDHKIDAVEGDSSNIVDGILNFFGVTKRKIAERRQIGNRRNRHDTVSKYQHSNDLRTGKDRRSSLQRRE
jgi:small-conductance mechanosensitive channel/CRP-like cAMP-binding protein